MTKMLILMLLLTSAHEPSPYVPISRGWFLIIPDDDDGWSQPEFDEDGYGLFRS
jgi:hypothetical protein